MKKLSAAERIKILRLIDVLLLLDATGWDVKDQLIACGDLLGSDEKPKYMPKDLTSKEYAKFVRIAKRNDIPARVFNDRLRRGKPPMQAANTPYLKKNGAEETPFLLIAKQNNISAQTYHWRRRKGWSPEKACTVPTQRERKKRGPDQT